MKIGRTRIVVSPAIAVAILPSVGCSRQKPVRPENTHMPPAIESINGAQSAAKIIILVGVHREIKHVISHCVEEETTGKRVFLAGEKMSSIPDGKRIEVKGYMKKEYWDPKGLSPFPSQRVEYLQVSEIKIIEYINLRTAYQSAVPNHYSAGVPYQQAIQVIR